MSKSIRSMYPESSEIQDHVNDAAGKLQSLWFGFMGLSAFIVIIAADTGHEDVFLDKTIGVPIVNVDLPIAGFYLVSPIIFVLFHLYIAIRINFLLESFREYKKISESEISNPATRLEHSRYFGASLFLQAQRAREDGSMLVRVLAVVSIVITVAIVPAAALIFCQIKIIPYQSNFVTDAQIVTIALDMLVVAFVVFSTLRYTEINMSGIASFTVYAALAAVVLWSALTITFPSSRFDGNLVARTLWGTDSSFGMPSTSVNRWFETTLDLANQDFVDDDLLTVDRAGYTLNLVGRSFIGANFDRVDMRQADFTNADLRGSDFRHAKFQGSRFLNADLRGAKLEVTELQNSNMQYANVGEALIANARFQGSQLECASFVGAHITGTKFQGSDMRGTSFVASQISNSNFDATTLYGVQFQLSDITNTSFRWSTIQSAPQANVPLYRVHVFGAQFDSKSTFAGSIPGQFSHSSQIKFLNRKNCYKNEQKEGETIQVWVPLDDSAIERLQQNYLVTKTSKKRIEKFGDLSKTTLAVGRHQFDRAQNQMRTSFNNNEYSRRFIELVCGKESAPYMATALIRSLRLKGLFVTNSETNEQMSAAAYVLEHRDHYDKSKAAKCTGARELSDWSLNKLWSWAQL
ncbi:MAG: pentapeptide repeat-containing protein [Pseudomonadota bacterium]